MTRGSTHRIPEQIRELLGGRSLVGHTDSELLDRFLSCRDDRAGSAFEALVVRHGALVWGVCRRALADPTDADDAFQATFLVLARRANSVRVDDSLGRWLYGVSRRVAARTRADRDRRRRRESAGVVPERAVADSTNLDQVEALSALDAEVARLREPFRSAILLCDLGGLTHEQAAVEVGCPVGTIKSRLARGRDQLRARLVRRGIGWDSMLPWFGPKLGPAHLIDPTVRGASALLGAGSGASPVVFSGWFLLKNGVCSMMISIPFQWLAGTTLALGLGAMGLTWVAAQQDNPASASAPTSARPTKDQPGSTSALVPENNLPREFNRVAMPDYVVEPPDIIIVEVQGSPDGRPISGERLVQPNGKISLGFYGEVFAAGLTTQEIKAKLVLHLQKFLTDEQLGLAAPKSTTTPRTAEELAAARRIFVDVASYNSKVYYVQGLVQNPGRLPVTGNETVLDALIYAGGLLGTDLGRIRVFLIRPAPPGKDGEARLPVNFKAIVEAGDATTNYQVMPSDRIVVTAEPAMSDIEIATLRTSRQIKEQQDRLEHVEKQLDLILRRLDALDKPR